MRTFILSIACLLVFTSMAQASAHNIFGALKLKSFEQTDTNTLNLDPFDPFEFDVFYETSPDEIVTVTFLQGENDPITLESHPDGILELPESVPHHFSTIEALNFEYPNNDSYAIHITSSLIGGNTIQATFNFGSADNYFVAPQFSNTGFIDGVLKFNFNQDFIFNWNTDIGFVNGTDHLFLFIEEQLIDGGFVDIVEIITSQFTSSHTLSGGTLDPLKTYDLELAFANVLGNVISDVPDHTGIVAFGTITSLELMHVPEPGTYSLIFGLTALGFVVLRRRRS